MCNNIQYNIRRLSFFVSFYVQTVVVITATALVKVQPFDTFLFTQNGPKFDRFAIGSCRNSRKTVVSRDSDASSRFRAAAGQSTSPAPLSLRKG
jgi:hypothetical protein